MPVLQVQDEFQSGDNVTASSLNDLVNEASFVSGAVDNSTLQVASAGHLKVKDNGILSNHLKSDASNDSVRAVTTNHIRNDAVTNAKIANLAVDTDQIAADAVTYAKIQNVSATDRVLGRDSAGAGNVEEITPSALRTMINVEDGATADQTASEIKTAYESNSNTNVFTDAEKSKLTGIEAGATADQTASEIKTAYESNSNTNAFTDAEKSKLTGIEAGATADQSASEIKTAYESNSDTNAFTDAEKSKLTGIAAGAEVNVQSDWNQTTSTADDFIKNKPSNATTTADGFMSSADKTKLDGLTTYSAGTGLNLTGTTFNLDNTVPAGAVDFNPGTTDFIQNSYTDAQRTNEGFPTDGGVLAKSRPSSATDDGNIWFMCNRSDNTSYGRVNVVNTNPNAKGAIFQAVAFRPTATALAGTPSNTSDSEFYVSASCQVQTLSSNFTGYNPRLALTFQNYVTSGVSNIFINADTVHAYSTTAASNRMQLGTSSNLWSEVFANNGTINTSDERLKQDIEDLSEAETRVAVVAKGLLKKFRWKDAVQQKGENARIHFGVIAQDLIAAFEAEGLDPFKYSVICFNEWWRNPEDPTDCRDEEVEGWEYGSQYAVRYDELLAFIIAAL